MKRALFWILSIAALLTAESAFGFWNRVKASNGKYGYKEGRTEAKSSSTAWKIEPIFDDCAWGIDPYGYASAKINGKWGIIDSKGQFVVEPLFAELASVSLSGTIVGNGVIVIAKAYERGRWGAINMHGEFVIPPIYDVIMQQYSSVDKPVMALADGRLSCVSPVSGPIFVTEFECRCMPIDYCSFLEPDNPSSMIVPVKIDGKWGAVGRNGTLVVNPRFDFMSGSWHSDMNVVRYRGKCGVIDRTFEFRIAAEYDDMEHRHFASGIDYFVVKRDGRYGAIDMNGDVIVPIKQKGKSKVSAEKCASTVRKRDTAGAYKAVRDTLAAAKSNMLSRLESECRLNALSHSDSLRLGRKYNAKARGCAEPAEAAYWHNRAAWLGNVDSQSALASILCDKSFVPTPAYGAIFAMLDKAFSNGIYDSAKTLGECYLYGRGTRCDYERAINAFAVALAREPSSPYIKSRLGDCYYALGTMGDCMTAREFYRQGGNKEGVGRCDSRIAEQKKKYKSARKQFTVNKDKNNVAITKTLADTYNTGKRYCKAGDYGSAYSCFKKVADAGVIDAVLAIVELYQEERPGFTDASQRLYWHERYARETGHPPVFGYVGDEYFKAGDYYKAYRWYKPAADAGYDYAQYRTGYMYEMGLGIAADMAKAEEYYKKAAEQNIPEAQHNLAVLCQSKGNDTDAAYWYRLAAEQGINSSMTNLAVLLTPKDNGSYDNMIRAKRYAVAAAVLGDNIAQYNAGLYYYSNKCTGGKPDFVTAAYWFRQGATSGNTDAMRILGECYYYGEGVEKNCASAYKWSLKAARKGSGLAMRDMAMYYAVGTDAVKEDKVQARKWYEMAVATGEDLGLTGRIIKTIIYK